MDKKIISIIVLIILILGCNSTIYAANNAITFSKNKNSYIAGDTIQISVDISNISLENGIETVIGTISYNKNLYESCSVEGKNGWKADFNEENGKVILQRNDGMKENGGIFIIKLKLKNDVTEGDTISFSNINIADENTDLYPEAVNTSVSITNKKTDQEEKKDQENQEDQEKQQDTENKQQESKKDQQDEKQNQTQQKKGNEDTTQKKGTTLPKTGKKIGIIHMVISVLLIINYIFSYNYLKNKM